MQLNKHANYLNKIMVFSFIHVVFVENLNQKCCLASEMHRKISKEWEFVFEIYL